MGIIAKLKDVLGIADRPARPRRAESTDVAVEREADTATEEAVKGTETDTTDEATTETTDAATTTETSDAATGTADVDSDEAAIQDAEPDEVESQDAEPDDGAADEDGEPVDAIKGIGTSYAERLGEAGVQTVADLAAADAEELADETGIGAGRIGNWIERAQVRNR